MANPATPPTRPPITVGDETRVLLPPDCEVSDGGLGLIVPAGSPEPPSPPPAPPIITPEVVGTRDEEVKDCGVEVDVVEDEVDDLIREVLKED